ncbi:alpha/beta hydrolase [Erythrobacter mangrovi]|uniref:Alpha/beta hydrolase n=1 Tax=Erythrobacter mangrovi TaxID=2739433 RepID=A0A7D3XK08_9SPHN|nr:alpha/beta hydrolase [Erythrobacter mangrovi]QKG72379.1 alpha/beta hydrolase [Erythrobacter mangrovi]
MLDSRRVALVGETDHGSPGAFRAMLRDFPGLEQLDMVECPGTRDDVANMKLGRMIRTAGMVTHVPSIGSVRSGAVELFLAGIERDIADGAEFAVHSWIDDYGREAADYAADAPENRKYIDYYREMGMSTEQARAFYDFTNSVPHRSALWLGARDMRRWVRPAFPAFGERRPVSRTIAPSRAVREEVKPAAQAAPKLAYADMTFS